MRKEYDFSKAKRNPYARPLKKQIAALRQLKDEDIALSDIPEITDWSKAVRGKYYRPLAVYCADIGSVKKENFGWYGGINPASEGGPDIQKLVEAVASVLNKCQPVALGFECPLFVPLPNEASHLPSGRLGEGNRPWCAGAGSSALATGLVEVLWILRAIRERVSDDEVAFLDWKTFRKRGRGLFLWEAFVSGGAHTEAHVDDARRAVESFSREMCSSESPSAIRCTEGDAVYSLIGAALLHSGWTSDVRLLSEPCLVIKAS